MKNHSVPTTKPIPSKKTGQAHTPEPWADNGQGHISCDAAGECYYINITHCKREGGPTHTIEHPEADANAARIVACVNACRGLTAEQVAAIPRLRPLLDPNPEMDQMIVGGITKHFAAFEAMRKALETLRIRLRLMRHPDTFICRCVVGSYYDIKCLYCQARDALKLVEECGK